MKKQKNKFALALLMLAFASGCVGAGVATIVQTPPNNVEAQAETTYTTHDIGALGLHVNSSVGGAKDNNAVLYLQRADGAALPVLDWGVAFATTDGFKINGEVAAVEMKSTPDGMYFSFSALNAGDVITISGEYVCEANATKYTIAKSQFIWTGSAWDKYIEVEYTTYEIGALQFFSMEPNRANMAYFNRVDGEAIPIKSTENNANWDTAFNFLANSGVGITLNGQSITPTLKFPDQVFIELSANPKAGDILVIGGTFYSQDLAAKYVIAESSFKFNGTSWENYTEGEEGTDTPEITYTEYNADELIVHIHSTAGNANANNTTLWLYGTGDTSDAWAYYTCINGAGIKINGETATVNVQDFSGGLYLKDFTVNAGDVISIGGTFVNEERAIKYIVAEASFQWNGSGWVAYEQPVEYTEYTISNLRVADTSMAGGAYCANNVLSLTMEGGATVSDWPWFVYESGAGFKVNGETAALTGGIANAVQDTNGGLYFQFAAVNSGDVVSIGGVFSNADLAIRYTIPETQFQWNGFDWEGFVEYTTYELGTIAPNMNSTTFGAHSARCDHLYTEGSIDLPVQDWESAFALDSGYGVQVNGEEISSYEIKSTEGGLWFGLSNIKAGDVVSICGTFKNVKHAAKYVIEESKMVWNGSTWEQYVEYTTYEIGEMRIMAEASSANAVYLKTASGEALPINSWDYRFLFLGDSGVGITLNGEQVVTNDIKSPDGNMYISFNGLTAEEGAVLKVGGTFRNLDTAAAYVIVESEFVYVDSVWKNRIDLAKEAACADLEAYKANFSQENYYEAEWASFDTIIEEGKAEIGAATTNEEIETAVAAAKAKMDNVVTKEQSDAIFDGLKVTAKEELSAYKNEADYRAEEWTAIQDILTQANTAIDASESVTAINEAVDSAKTAMDAVKTNAQWEADEAVVASAKAELAAYKNEADYYETEWAAIQAIITEANADIDNAIGNETTILEIVATAKTAIDAVKTTQQVDADVAVATEAKAELAAYKNEADYYEAEWTAIQAIITAANADIDNAIGDEAEIAEIVESAKVDIDEVKTAKEVAADEVRAYYNALNHDLYSEEAETEISGYVSSVMQAIEDATTNAELDAAIAQFKANVESVEKVQPSVGSSDGAKEDAGCGAIITSGLSAGVVLGVAAAALLRKKKED